MPRTSRAPCPPATPTAPATTPPVPTGTWVWGAEQASSKQGMERVIAGCCITEIDNINAPVVAPNGERYAITLVVEIRPTGAFVPDDER